MNYHISQCYFYFYNVADLRKKTLQGFDVL